MAVPAVYGRYLSIRNLDQRISLCDLQAVVHHPGIVGLFQLPQSGAGDTCTVQDSFNGTVPYRVGFPSDL